MWLPIVGWAIAGALRSVGIGRATGEIREQLEGRYDFSAEAWSAAGVQPQYAEDVAQAITRRLELPNHHLLPDDPLILLLLDEDGMGFFQALFAIKRDLNIEVRLEGLPADANFQDLVNRVYPRAIAT